MDFNGWPPPPPASAPLLRQGSVYSLTFDEFQTALGGGSKELGSMNMEELLQSIWTAEESHVMAGGGGTSSRGARTADPALQRQPTLSIPRTLSQKTVDEVWRDIMSFAGVGLPDPPQSGFVDPITPCQQQTLGEMTLEEFLDRAGVYKDELVSPPVAAPLSANHTAGMTMPMPAAGAQFSITDAAAAAVAMPSSTPKVNGSCSETSPTSPGPPVLSPCIHRPEGGVMKKVTERRQRRMIKNRESAARSRARKQAYIVELETEISKLREINEALQRKQAKLLEVHKFQEEDRKRSKRRSESKDSCLRRTSTGPW